MLCWDFFLSKQAQTWWASAGRLEQYQGRDCSLTTYLIATDNLGVSQHTGIFTNLYHPQHQTWGCSRSACIDSLWFTEHYSFTTDAVEMQPARPGRGVQTTQLTPSLWASWSERFSLLNLEPAGHSSHASLHCCALQAGNLIKIMPPPHPHSVNTENTFHRWRRFFVQLRKRRGTSRLSLASCLLLQRDEAAGAAGSLHTHTRRHHHTNFSGELNVSYHFAPPERRVWIFLKGSQSHCPRTFRQGGGGLWTPEDSLGVLVCSQSSSALDGKRRCYCFPFSPALSLRDGDALLLLLLLHRSVTLGVIFFFFPHPRGCTHARPLLVLRRTDSRGVRWRHASLRGRGEGRRNGNVWTFSFYSVSNNNNNRSV